MSGLSAENCANEVNIYQFGQVKVCVEENVCECCEVKSMIQFLSPIIT